MSRRAIWGPSGFHPDHVARLATIALLFCLAFLALQLAVSSRGTVPDYDAVDYIGTALRAHLGLIGALDVPGQSQWYGVGLTNSLDTLILALVYDLVDYHVAVWAIHTAYIVAFAWLLARLLGRPTALFVTAWALANVYFLHQYTNYISELKVGLFLVLFVVYLFHPDAPRHRVALFWITALLVGLRTINLLFILPLVAVYVGLRLLDRSRRGEIAAVLKPIVLGVIVLSPLLFRQIPGLLTYIHDTSTRSQKNWLDMSGVYGKFDLLRTYYDGLLGYNRMLQFGAAALALVAVAIVVAGRRTKLAALAEPLLATVIVFAILMQAATTNVNVIFWLFALEALLAGLIVRSLAPAWLVTATGSVLAVGTMGIAYSSFLAASLHMTVSAPIQALGSDLARALQPVAKPVIYANFRGIGPLDTSGLEIRLGRVVRWPSADQVSYNRDMRFFMTGQRAANVAFIAGGNFLWPVYIGVNHHTGEIAGYFAQHAEELGWLRAQRLRFDNDPSRFVDVYVRPTVTARLKWTEYGDTWMDVDTPVEVNLPKGDRIPPNYQLQLAAMFPATGDKAFVPPWKATLVDAGGITVATAQATTYGDNVLDFPVAGLAAGLYHLRFERGFKSPDPRELVAMLKDMTLVPPDARP